MTTYRAAVIGLGTGRDHITCLRAEGRAEVAALCDVNETLLAQTAQQLGVPFQTTDYREIARREDIQLVVIATPDHLHAGPAIAMMESGKHVLIEKPMATTLEDIRRIVEVARRTKSVVTHGCQLRFLPEYQELKRRVTAGDLGEIYYAEGDYIANHLSLFQKGWRGDLGADYNALAGGGVHPLDLLLWLISDDPVSVYACGNNISAKQYGLPGTDCTVATVRFRRGAVAKCLVAFVAIRPGMRNIALYGTKGTFVTVPSGPSPLLALAGQEKQWTPMPVAPSSANPRVAMLADWIDAIESGRPPLIDVTQGAVVSAVCAAGFESLRSGRPESVPAVV